LTEFPKWLDFVSGIKKFERAITKHIIETKMKSIQNVDALGAQAQDISLRLILLPHPFNLIARNISNDLDGSLEDKYYAVLKF
jgi:hypothetical protein